MEVISDLAALAFSGFLLAMLRRNDRYDRLFFWRNPKTLAQLAEKKALETFVALCKTFAFVTSGLVLCVIVFQIHAWRLCADLLPGFWTWPFCLLPTAQILLFVLWFLCDLLPQNRGLLLPTAVRSTLHRGMRTFATFYTILVITAVALIATLWTPSDTILLREMTAWANLSPATLKAQKEALTAPHTVLGDLARTWAVKGLLFRGDGSPAPRQIIEQILNNTSDSSPSIRAAAYLQLTQLASRTESWADRSKYFDKALDELKKSEPNMKSLRAIDNVTLSLFQRPRGEIAVTLAQIAAGNKDRTRLKQITDFISEAKIPLTAMDQAQLNYLSIPARGTNDEPLAPAPADPDNH